MTRVIGVIGRGGVCGVPDGLGVRRVRAVGGWPPGPISRIALLVACLGGLLTSARAPAADSCSVSASGVNFGVYDPTAGSSATSTGTLLVSCNWTAPAPAQITVAVYLSTGSSGTYSARSMTSGSNRLAYNLYFNANGSTIWGNGTGGSYYGSATIVTGTPSGSGTANGTLYGIAPPGQDVAPGAYSDTITITVNY